MGILFFYNSGLRSPVSILNIDIKVLYIVSSDRDKIWLLFDIVVVNVPCIDPEI